MEKIKVSRAVANFIESYEKSYMYVGWDNKMLSEHAYQYCSGSYLDESLKGVTPLQLSKILIYGYEVEETPEEHLSRLYLFPPKYLWVDNTHRSVETRIKIAYRDGIEIALKLMEVEVKGIHK